MCVDLFEFLECLTHYVCFNWRSEFFALLSFIKGILCTYLCLFNSSYVVLLCYRKHSTFELEICDIVVANSCETMVRWI